MLGDFFMKVKVFLFLVAFLLGFSLLSYDVNANYNQDVVKSLSNNSKVNDNDFFVKDFFILPISISWKYIKPIQVTYPTKNGIL